jgi:hypothetical protein
MNKGYMHYTKGQKLSHWLKSVCNFGIDMMYICLRIRGQLLSYKTNMFLVWPKVIIVVINPLGYSTSASIHHQRSPPSLALLHRPLCSVVVLQCWFEVGRKRGKHSGLSVTVPQVVLQC